MTQLIRGLKGRARFQLQFLSLIRALGALMITLIRDLGGRSQSQLHILPPYRPGQGVTLMGLEGVGFLWHPGTLCKSSGVEDRKTRSLKTDGCSCSKADSWWLCFFWFRGFEEASEATIFSGIFVMVQG